MLYKIVSSILTDGDKSIYLNDFITMCTRISLAALRKNIFKDFVLSKTGISESDFAIDIVADLFKNVNGKYTYFDNYLGNHFNSSKLQHEEVLLSKINAIVISRTNQRINEIREEVGEIYFRVKRAALLHIKRQKHYCLFQLREKSFISLCNENEIISGLPEIDESVILDKLNSSFHKKLSVSVIVDEVIEYVNLQNNYLRAVEDSVLFKAVSDFYKLRKSDYLLELENVSYYYSEGE